MTTKLEQAALALLAHWDTPAWRYLKPTGDLMADLREALAEQSDMNLNCKSVQARLATSWGYVKAEQAEQEPIRFVWNGEGWIEADDYIWKTTPDAERRELYAAPQPAQEPVARVTGYHGGRCVVEPLNRALVLPTDMALYAEPVQQVTRADLKAAFKEGFERAADLYAPNDGQEPYAYEVWDVQDQSFTMIYATQLKEFHWIEPENIARVLYAAPVKQAEQEPVAYVSEIYQSRYTLEWNGRSLPVGTNFYTAPVRTKDLTDVDLWNLWEKSDSNIEFARAVIAADRSKNNANNNT